MIRDTRRPGRIVSGTARPRLGRALAGAPGSNKPGVGFGKRLAKRRSLLENARYERPDAFIADWRGVRQRIKVPPIFPADPPQPDTFSEIAVEQHEGLEFGQSPVDLPADPAHDQAGLRWTATIFAVSSGLLLAFNSFAIDKWARQLEPTQVTGPIKDMAASWHGAMQSLHLDAPLEAGRSAWRAAKAAQWDEDAKEPPTAPVEGEQ